MNEKRKSCTHPQRGLSLSIEKNKPKPKKPETTKNQHLETKIHALGPKTPRGNSLKLIEKIR